MWWGLAVLRPADCCAGLCVVLVESEDLRAWWPCQVGDGDGGLRVTCGSYGWGLESRVDHCRWARMDMNAVWASVVVLFVIHLRSPMPAV